MTRHTRYRQLEKFYKLDKFHYSLCNWDSKFIKDYWENAEVLDPRYKWRKGFTVYKNSIHYKHLKKAVQAHIDYINKVREPNNTIHYMDYTILLHTRSAIIKPYLLKEEITKGDRDYNDLILTLWNTYMVRNLDGDKFVEKLIKYGKIYTQGGRV